jgi:ribonuclease Z
MIDCGEGAQIQLKRFGNVRYSRFSNIFISHLHGDHVFGLFGLLSTLDLLGKKHDLNIYAPKELSGMLNLYRSEFGENMRYRIIHHAVNTYENSVVYEDDFMTVETIPLKHRIPTCGYLFREKMPKRNIHKEAILKYNIPVAEIERIKHGADFIDASGRTVPNDELTYIPYQPRSYAFCSDTVYDDKVAEIVQGVDLLYHEATFLDDMRDVAAQTGHSTARQAGEVALKAGVKKLLVGHFSSRYDDLMLEQFRKEAQSVFPNSDTVYDGAKYEIPRTQFAADNNFNSTF